ncbi:MAG TPA: hypothetical protein VGR53_09895 [Nitrososphaerales archaeon]|nr:hypothetical protein [Nitrososphaerales archaeon]
MTSVMKPGRAPMLVVLLVLIVVAAGFAYYYSVSQSSLASDSASISTLGNQVSSLQGQVGSLQSHLAGVQANLTKTQNLDSARNSIGIIAWLASPGDTTNQYQVKITNNNAFAVTLSQLAINVVDRSGVQIASNTVAPQLTVAGGSSISTQISVVFPNNASGVNVNAIIQTPYGQIFVGSA